MKIILLKIGLSLHALNSQTYFPIPKV